jgi:hypothetical protein
LIAIESVPCGRPKPKRSSCEGVYPICEYIGLGAYPRCISTALELVRSLGTRLMARVLCSAARLTTSSMGGSAMQCRGTARTWQRMQSCAILFSSTIWILRTFRTRRSVHGSNTRSHDISR